MMENKIQLRRDIEFTRTGDVMHPAIMLSQSASDTKELEFWRRDKLECPQGDLFDNIVVKSDFIRIFGSLTPLLNIKAGNRVLEVGGGHCWASTVSKRHFPQCYIVASDLSPSAVQFAAKYESLLGVSVDEKWAFNIRNAPFADAQFDIIYGFACFHHFCLGAGLHDAMREIVRLLKPGGAATFLYEPSSPAMFYPLMLRRVNGKRASVGVDEDVVRLRSVKKMAERLGCQLRVQYYPTALHRNGVLETVYYVLLGSVAPLARFFPCTVNFSIIKST